MTIISKDSQRSEKRGDDFLKVFALPAHEVPSERWVLRDAEACSRAALTIYPRRRVIFRQVRGVAAQAVAGRVETRH